MISSNDMGNLNQSQSWLDEIHKHYNLALFSPAHSLMCIAIRSTYAGSVTMTLQCCMDSSEQLVFQYFWCTYWFRQSCFSRSFQWWALLCKFRCYEAKIDKSEKGGSCMLGVEPRSLLAWAASALLLSHDSLMTTNLKILHMFCIYFQREARCSELLCNLCFSQLMTHKHPHVMTDNRMQLLVSLRIQQPLPIYGITILANMNSPAVLRILLVTCRDLGHHLYGTYR